MPTEAERIRALTAKIGDLEEAVDGLHESIEEQNLHNARKIGWSIGAAAFAVILSALVLVGYLKQVETSDRLARNDERIEVLISQQEVLRVQVLCPLYKVMLGSYAPESRAPGPDRDKYEQVFTDMRAQYAVLRCVGDLVPPRGDLVTKPPK